ncbi:MAG: TldD/PmbA family protein [Fusobacteria bacterium]|nr:TldD/PmbA family protein [Fusobacteriota bacterium]
MELKINEIRDILATAVAGHDFSEIYFEKKYSTQLLLVNKIVEEITEGVEEGASIRIIKGDKSVFGHTNDVTYEGLFSLASTLNPLGGELPEIIVSESIEEAPKNAKIDYNTVSLDEKIELLELADKFIHEKNDPFLQQFSSGYNDASKVVEIINSRGIHTKECINRGVYRNTVILSKEGDIQTGYESIGSSNGFEHFTHDKILAAAKEALRVAHILLESKSVVSGVMDVIIAGKAGGTMIHEACGHGLELDLVQEEVSIFRKYKNQKIASEKLTVIDSGIEPGFFGSTYFDDEGIKTELSILIDKGVVVNFMNSQLTAMKSNVTHLTGSGRREAYKKMPIPRMRNTYIQVGNDTLEEMLKQTQKGLYVARMGGGQVDTVTGEFVFAALEAYVIENGEITYPVRNATLQSDGKKVLENITHIGSDLHFTVGQCGKSGQGVPVTSGQPTIRITNITVGGN